ncbi:MAG: IS481 family transposase [Gammaproteobacteria bacterium]|nr:IS481 family transposase [Gammaproteobacteria bacterium]
MNITLHKKARTAPAVRREIQCSKLSERKPAEKYGISRSTVRKWKFRDTTDDFSHRPHNLHATLTDPEEAAVVELRRTLLLPPDDLPVVVHEFICPHMSRSALDRCLRRHGVSNLKKLIPREENEKKQLKTFKDYEPGFVHIDIKYLPRMPDGAGRKYLFVGIDRATRWVHMEIRASETAESSRSFLKNFIEKAPFGISRVLTDNGKEFTDRFCSAGQREPTGSHIFDQKCAEHNIGHRLIKPRTPQTNGMVERLNGRVKEVPDQTRFESSRQLKETLMRYLRIYNHHIPQKNLGHITPVEALKNWRKTHPDLFKKMVYNQSGLDS